MPRYYFIRHAETTWNREDRIQGSSDVGLSEAGQAQARRLGALFASRPLARVVTSALQRSRQTAQAITSANGHHLTPVLEPDLAEIRLGAWEGLTPAEVNAQFADAYDRWSQCDFGR